MALIAGLTCSALAIAVSSTSLALTSRLAMSPARETASCLRYSSNLMAGRSPTSKFDKNDDSYSDCARGLTIGPFVPFMFLEQGTAQSQTAAEPRTRLRCRYGRTSHDPPRGFGRLLRLGRAAARPVLARPADCGGWRGRARRLLRSQGFRGP